MAWRHEQNHAQALRGARLLVVEDNFIILLQLESILLEAGAEIAGLCGSVEEALAMAEADDLAAAILDVRVGQEKVTPVAQKLRERGVPLVFYTGQADTDPISSEWPGCAVISKPAPPSAIVDAVAGAVRG